MTNLQYCINELNNLQKGEVFTVKDLFKGYLWNRLKNERLTLGTLFLAHIKSNPQLNIKILNKTSSNQQKYVKI